MNRRLRSRDPLKAKVVACIRRRFGYRRLTEVRQTGDRTFQARCFMWNELRGHYEYFGTFAFRIELHGARSIETAEPFELHPLEVGCVDDAPRASSSTAQAREAALRG